MRDPMTGYADQTGMRSPFDDEEEKRQRDMQGLGALAAGQGQPFAQGPAAPQAPQAPAQQYGQQRNMQAQQQAYARAAAPAQQGPGMGALLAAPAAQPQAQPRPQLNPQAMQAFANQQQMQPGPMGAQDPRLPDATSRAAAGAGAAAAGAPWAAVLMQALDRHRQQNAARQQAIQGARAGYAQQYGGGYPGARMQAAQANQQIGNMEGGDYLQYLLPFMGGRGGR